MNKDLEDLVKEMAAAMQTQAALSSQAQKHAVATNTLVNALAVAVFQASPETRKAMEKDLRRRLSNAEKGDNALSKDSTLLALQLMGWEPL